MITKARVHAAKDFMTVAGLVGVLIQIGGNKAVSHYVSVIKKPILVTHLFCKLKHKKGLSKKNVWIMGGIVVNSISGFQKITGQTFGDFQNLYKTLKAIRSGGALIFAIQKARKKNKFTNKLSVAKRLTKIATKGLKKLKVAKGYRLGTMLAGKTIAVYRVFLRRMD